MLEREGQICTRALWNSGASKSHTSGQNRDGVSGASIDSVYRISNTIIANKVAKIAFKAPGLHRATTRAFQPHIRPMRRRTTVIVRETSINSCECLRFYIILSSERACLSAPPRGSPVIRGSSQQPLLGCRAASHGYLWSTYAAWYGKRRK